MSNAYAPPFYDRWLRRRSAEIANRFHLVKGSDFPLSSDSDLINLVNGEVDGSGIKNNMSLVDAVLKATSNEPSNEDLYAGSGANVGWRTLKMRSGVLSMRADLLWFVREEYKTRGRAAKKFKADLEANIPAAQRLLPLAEVHAAQDDYRKGRYIQPEGRVIKRFRGCSIGCTIHDAKQLGMVEDDVFHNSHRVVAKLLFGGVEQLAHLQDNLFEKLPDDESVHWTPRLLRTITYASPNIDWDLVWRRWLAGTMKLLLKMGYILDYPLLRISAQRARDLNALASDGVTITDGDWCAAINDNGRWRSKESSTDGSPLDQAYYAVHQAVSMTDLHCFIFNPIYAAGVSALCMAEVLIESIEKG